MSIKRVVKKVDFSGEGSHIAAVKDPANRQSEVSIMKSKGGNVGGKEKSVDVQKAEEVRITTSMATFLETFFRMWHEDANELAEMLGYEPQEWFFDMVGDDTTVEMLKSADDTTTVNKEVYENLKKARPIFNKLKNKYEKDLTKEKEMGDEDVKKRLEELEKAKKEYEAEVEKYKTEAQTEKEKRKELEKEQIKKEKENYKTLFKGYSFVDEGKVDDIVDVAIKCKGVEGFGMILETLEKANESLKAALEDEKGTSEKDTTTVEKGSEQKYVSDVENLIKKRYSKE